MISNIIKFFNHKKDKKDKFNQIMDFATYLEKNKPHSLINLIIILLRPLQSELLISSIEHEEHQSHKGVMSHKFFMPNCKDLNLQFTSNSPQFDRNKFLIHLNRDPILPCPWLRSRHITNIGNYCGKWKQDISNHSVSIWLPWGIAFVHGGNHSISAGIINSEGTLVPKNVYDMSFLLNTVKCDGENYILIENNEVLDTVNDIRIAAVFEIGRMLHKNNIIPMHI